jgi:transposase-like protein
MMTHHKSEDYKTQAVKYYLVEDNTQEEVCRIFECSRRSLMRWVKHNIRKKGIFKEIIEVQLLIK